jgi:hypothetical protein
MVGSEASPQGCDAAFANLTRIHPPLPFRLRMRGKACRLSGSTRCPIGVTILRRKAAESGKEDWPPPTVDLDDLIEGGFFLKDRLRDPDQ